MRFEAEYKKALDGEKYESKYLKDTLFKVTKVHGNTISQIIVVKTKKSEESATGKVTTTSFIKWEETENAERFKRCFDENEFILVTEERLLQFNKI